MIPLQPRWRSGISANTQEMPPTPWERAALLEEWLQLAIGSSALDSIRRCDLAALIRGARWASGLTRRQFASRIGYRAATVRAWEEGLALPTGAARTALG